MLNTVSRNEEWLKVEPNKYKTYTEKHVIYIYLHFIIRHFIKLIAKLFVDSFQCLYYRIKIYNNNISSRSRGIQGHKGTLCFRILQVLTIAIYLKDVAAYCVTQ